MCSPRAVFPWTTVPLFSVTISGLGCLIRFPSALVLLNEQWFLPLLPYPGALHELFTAAVPGMYRFLFVLITNMYSG